MFLYTQGIKSSMPAIRVANEEVNYYEAISKEQTKFLNAVNEASVACYKELYFANGDKKIVTEGLKEYWDKLIKYLKKVRDAVIAFFKKWYNKIKEFLSSKKESMKYKAIKELIDNKDKATKLAMFNYDSEYQVFNYQPYFSMLNNGMAQELGMTISSQMTTDEILKDIKVAKVFKKYGDFKDISDYWKGTPTMRLTLKDIEVMYLNIENLPDKIEALRKEATGYIDLVIKTAETMRKDDPDNYTPEIGNRVATYQTVMNSFLKEAMQTSIAVETEYGKVFAKFAVKAQEFLMQ